MQNKDVGTVGYVIGSDGMPDLGARWKVQFVSGHDSLLLQALNRNGTGRSDRRGMRDVPVTCFIREPDLDEALAVRSA